MALRCEEWNIDDDAPSELVLSELLVEEGTLLSENWYYSTEIKILCPQLIYNILFLFLDDWSTIRVVGNGILYFLLLISSYYLCVQINKKNVFPILGIFLLSPISLFWFNYTLYGAFYIPCIMISILFVALNFHFINTDIKYKKYLICIFGGLLSFFTGLGGLRQLLLLYIPLVIAGLIVVLVDLYKEPVKEWINQKQVKFFVYTLIMSGFAFFGVLVNSSYLSKKYSFVQYESIMYTSIQWERILDVLEGLITTFGYKWGRPIFSVVTFHNLLAVVFALATIVSIIYLLKRIVDLSYEKKIMICFYVVALLIFTALFVVTDMTYAENYAYPIIVFTIPVIAIFWQEAGISTKLKKFIYVVAAITLVLNALLVYDEYKTVDSTEDLREIVSLLQQEGYYNGYSNGWDCGNSLTELSDGSIEVWVLDQIDNYKSDVYGLDRILLWLQKKSHTTEVPSGRVFLVFSLSDAEGYPIIERMDEEHLIYTSQDHVVYGYESYDELIEGIQ